MSNKTKKQITKKHTKKQLTKKHIYYFVKCHDDFKDDLDGYILEQYLNKLDIKQDNKAMTTIKNIDINFFKKNNKQISTYCYKPVNLPEFDRNIINADIFILNSNSTHTNKRFYDIPKYLVNLLNSDTIKQIFNKFIITKTFMTINPKLCELYIPITFKINECDKYKFSDNMPIKWYILRPIDSFGGDDIKYISNIEELNDAIHYYNTTKNYKSHLYKNNVISSEYIHNPLLFNNKKFHLRLYYLVSYTNNILNTFLLDFGKILTAKEPFDMNDPFTKNKHDTHVNSTERDFIFPDDFTITNINKFCIPDEILNKIIPIFSILTRIIKNNKKNLLYPNEKNAYHIFGADIMLDDNFIPKLIEINESPGFSSRNNNVKQILSQNIYKWLNDTVLEPLLKYNNPLIARTHKTYIKPYMYVNM